MADEIAPTDATCIIGSVGTGKTHYLVEHTADLLTTHTAEDILILCATPQAARLFRKRLDGHVGNGMARRVTITTARALALEVLSTDEAMCWSGRNPRLLTEFEEKFLMEDMKVSGLRPKRLREMLRFFYRSWTELADDNPDWLLCGEEADVHALLKTNLTFTHSIIEPEVANLAVNFLRSHEHARGAQARTHVMIDDYQRMNRASQQLANLVASQSIVVTGDPAAGTEVYDSYPYVVGLDEFLETYPNALLHELTVCRCTYAAASAAQALLSDPGMNGPVCEMTEATAHNGAVVLSASSPDDEFSRVARFVADAAREGTPLSQIVVAVPNNTWATNMGAALRARGLDCESLLLGQPIRGDIRDDTRCIQARIMTALDLVANPEDAMAWRCWCGYGDYLAGSAAIANLRTFADEQNVEFLEALRKIGTETHASNDVMQERIIGDTHVTHAYRIGLGLIAHAQDLNGRSLLDELTRVITDDGESSAPPVIVDLCLPDRDSDDSAASMAHQANERLMAPTLPDREAVAIIPYDLTVGFSPDILIVTGFVNGFIPCRDYFDGSVMPLDKREKTRIKDTSRVYSLVGKAKQTLALSYFTSVDLENADALKLKINRIRLDHGTRMCTIGPSEFLSKIASD